MTAFDKIAAFSTPASRRYTSKTLDLVERIHDILESRGMSQKDLAERLDKQPSEISRWLTGLHNFEMRTLAKIEEALDEEIFVVNQPPTVTSKAAPADALYAEIQLLPAELQAEASSFIRYLRHKHEEARMDLSVENRTVAKKLLQYSMPNEAVAAVHEPPASEYQKKSTRKK